MPYVPDRTGIKDLNRFPFYNRDRLTDDIANDILGFDNAMSPWVPANIPGGAGNWSTVVPASYLLSTALVPHFLTMYNADAANPLIIKWSNAVSKTYCRTNIGVGLNAGGPDGLIFEIRLFEAQAPGAATKYAAARWTQDRATYPDHPLRFQWWYGTGITFTFNNGTALVANGMTDWVKGVQHLIHQISTATPDYSSTIHTSEGSPAYKSSLVALAALPAQFKEAWWYLAATSATLYPTITLDDIQVY